MTEIINIEPLRHDILFHFGSQEHLSEELDNYFDKIPAAKILDSASEIYDGVADAKAILEDGKVMVVMRQKPSTAEQFGTLAHEIFHAVNMVMQKIGATFSEESEEVYAYLIGYVTEKVIVTCGLSLPQLSSDEP